MDDDQLNRLSAALMDALAPDAERLMELYASGRTFAEIARELGISVSTTHHRVGKIQTHLAAYGVLPRRWRRRDLADRRLFGNTE